ncbi:MAG: response regulator transcription factor [Eubacteriales bacterium]|nr:response regulator transcription factor [Eubacteriales bacterium]
MDAEKQQILVVDDEERIVEFVESYLIKNGYAVHTAYNGQDALRLFQNEQIALIVLDLMLPDISGEEICKTIRKTSRVPIIMLTAKAEEAQILKGLDIGADDYVTKPFSPRQLVARVGALLRRAEGGNYHVSGVLSFNGGELVIDVMKHEVMKNGVSVSLTPIEFDLLVTMAKNPGRIYTRDDLITYALGDAYDGFDRSLDSHIKNLRHKIESDTKNCRFIVTVHGIGYKFGGEA